MTARVVVSLEDRAAKAARKEREELESARIAAMESLVLGDYQLHAHLIEARDLAGRDVDDSSDPYVRVSFRGQTRTTSVRENQASPVWDEHLFVRAPQVEPSALAQDQIEISVYDSDGISTNSVLDDLIGQFYLDATTLYFAKDHEIYRKWLALSAPYSKRKDALGNVAAGGVAGYTPKDISPSLLTSLGIPSPHHRPW